jgi:hypothetical protein
MDKNEKWTTRGKPWQTGDSFIQCIGTDSTLVAEVHAKTLRGAEELAAQIVREHNAYPIIAQLVQALRLVQRDGSRIRPSTWKKLDAAISAAEKE